MKQADRATGLGTAAFPPYTYIDGEPACGWLIVCDHASNALPSEYGTLGLPPQQLERHIGYDIGAAGVTRELAGFVSAPALMTNFSRILIDPNRGEDDPTLIMKLSDGAVVPGNAEIDEAERRLRIERYYEPYHTAIDQAIDRAIDAGRPPAILSIHTFTENWRGVLRPWHAGVLWDNDPRFPVPLLEALRAEEGIVADENVPYTGELKGDCLYKHGTKRGLAHALIEIRQDLVRESEGQKEWADRLARILNGMMANTEGHPDLNRICQFGSKTDIKGSHRPAAAAQ